MQSLKPQFFLFWSVNFIVVQNVVSELGKMDCIFPIVTVYTALISSEFHMGQYRDRDHREDAPHFIIRVGISYVGT